MAGKFSIVTTYGRPQCTRLALVVRLWKVSLKKQISKSSSKTVKMGSTRVARWKNFKECNGQPNDEHTSGLKTPKNNCPANGYRFWARKKDKETLFDYKFKILIINGVDDSDNFWKVCIQQASVVS